MENNHREFVITQHLVSTQREKYRERVLELLERRLVAWDGAAIETIKSYKKEGLGVGEYVFEKKNLWEDLKVENEKGIKGFVDAEKEKAMTKKELDADTELLMMVNVEFEARKEVVNKLRVENWNESRKVRKVLFGFLQGSLLFWFVIWVELLINEDRRKEEKDWLWW